MPRDLLNILIQSCLEPKTTDWREFSNDVIVFGMITYTLKIS